MYSAGTMDLYRRQKLALELEHVPSGHKVQFPAFIEMFSDMYNSNWNAEDVYGRMDPIVNYINTRRSLSVAWNVPADSYDHAQQNLEKMNKLISFLYPLYDSRGTGATAINQAPLVRIRFGNLIRNAQNGKGLLGYINGFTFDPNFDLGMFYGTTNPTDIKLAQAHDARFGESSGRNKTIADNLTNVEVEYLPKTFRLTFEFNILHEHAMGWKQNGKHFSLQDDKLNSLNFPYAVTNTARVSYDATTERLMRREEDRLKGLNQSSVPSSQGTVNNALSGLGGLNQPKHDYSGGGGGSDGDPI